MLRVNFNPCAGSDHRTLRLGTSYSNSTGRSWLRSATPVGIVSFLSPEKPQWHPAHKLIFKKHVNALISLHSRVILSHVGLSGYLTRKNIGNATYSSDYTIENIEPFDKRKTHPINSSAAVVLTKKSSHWLSGTSIAQSSDAFATAFNRKNSSIEG